MSRTTPFHHTQDTSTQETGINIILQNHDSTEVLTYRRPLPFKVNRDSLAEEERFFHGREIWILKQLSLLQTLQPELFKRLAVPLRALH